MQDAEQLPSFSELSDAGGVWLPWVQERRYFLDAEVSFASSACHRLWAATDRSWASFPGATDTP
ncbi:hypothetical protein [Pseudarthrobacter sp. NIBRBAC000502770]|uniref:hypothetical protein n=1 Tax=Pseudarthrobacter sp. NIBRBAC000502770 TaxID=2590785 RepID=UPI00113FE248|nr:hypothetical protein [Pseudarthrobacter sp. NIBRBAC000502770]QDG89065.1 hypothetical protein NIBR502770_11670 [Pseudarthrobacter sp. NIBRBAC000502770]